MKDKNAERGIEVKGAKLFWRIQKTCMYRAVTPYLMYLIMSLIMLCCQLIPQPPLKYILSVLCLIGGMAYNAHLAYHYGENHYGAYVAGCLHRQNALFGIESGGDHRVEREYRVWKGFLIGFYIGLPVILLGVIAGSVPALGTTGELILDMFAGWAIIPFQWIRDSLAGGWVLYLAAFMSVIPVTVTGIFYIVGAMREKTKREEADARAERVKEIGKKNKKQ